MAGNRENASCLVHGYYTISPEKVWDTVQEDIPVLKKQLLSILENL